MHSAHLTAYRQCRRSAADAVALVRDGDSIMVPTGVGEPPALLAALSDRRRSLHGVRVSQILAMRPYAYLDPATVEHVRHVAFFYGGATRPGGQAGWIDFIPNHFSERVFTMASPMDSHGYFSLSLATDYTLAAIRQARAVVLEVNPHVPFAYGNCHVHVSQVAALVESDEPLLEVGLPKIGPVQEAIGGQVAELIEDGSTLQIGYGGIADAVVMQLTKKHDLGIHTEMIGDGILTLIESGFVTNRRKNYRPGKMLATFALGSRRLYHWLDRNPALGSAPARTRSTTSSPNMAWRSCAASRPGSGQRAAALIGIAHPRFRDKLVEQARRLGLAQSPTGS